MSTKQSSVNVLMEAKFIVDELNALFQKNYNMLSLDGMSRIEMLQLISNVLKALEVLDNVSVIILIFFNYYGYCSLADNGY